ncbi:hypothetical protein Ahy_A05g025062 [Arachis hypogaea]|uniref:Uncharacterized protein n=1 Tax=Arachis hypogaea TaxID=3818 RepID=A0A445D7E5_ARAHY|nr:hypothetical protein Ahy_A05g025062 [Arachis hypogaea]
MAGEDSFIVLVHHRGSIKRKTQSGVKFTDKDPFCIIVSSTTSYDDLARSVLEKLGLEGVKRVKKFFYRIPITVLQDSVKYDSFTIGNDEHLQVMFLCRRQFSEVRTPVLLAKLVDVVSSSGGSNQNTNTLATVAGSSSRPAVASSSVPAYEPPTPSVVSPSFAFGDEVGIAKLVPTSVHCAAPAGAGDGLFDDVEDDDVKPDMIADDSGDEIGASEPAGAGSGSSSCTQQYPPHFSSLDLDAMRQPGHGKRFLSPDMQLGIREPFLFQLRPYSEVPGEFLTWIVLRTCLTGAGFRGELVWAHDRASVSGAIDDDDHAGAARGGRGGQGGRRRGRGADDDDDD